MIRAGVLVAFVLAGPALAQDAAIERAVENCMGEESRLDRLDCYDAIGPAFGLTAAESPWRVETRPSDLDGLPEVIVSTQAVRGRAAFDRPILLVARCRNDTTEVFVHWNQFLGADGGTLPDLWKDVTVQIGQGDPRTEQWPLSDIQEATFTPGWGGAFLRELAGADRLIARITPYDGAPLEAEFALTGLARALVPLTEACGWSLDR